MQSGEIKQRKKTSEVKENGKKRRSEDKDERKRETEEKENTIKSSDVTLVMSLMSLAVSLLLMWALYQQNIKFAEMKEQYEHFYEKTRGVLELQSQITTVSEKCERVQALISRSTPVSHLKSLDVEVSHLKEKFSNLTGQRHQLHQNLTHLVLAVENVKNRTLVVSSDVMSKVASVRTDLRRMGGLEGEVEALVSQTDTLEEKVMQIEKLMVKRIGDLLASSVDRVSVLKSSTERNAQRLDQINKLVQGLSTTDRQLSDRILTLESAQAKMLKMTTFATDLKPKVFTIRQDFNIIESKLSELTLRIGQIAEDVMRGEEELAEMKKMKDQTLEQKHLLTT